MGTKHSFFPHAKTESEVGVRFGSGGEEAQLPGNYATSLDHSPVTTQLPDSSPVTLHFSRNTSKPGKMGTDQSPFGTKNDAKWRYARKSHRNAL